MLTNCLAACAHLTISVSEIERDIYEKIVILSYPLAFDAPIRGVPVGISAPPFGMEKLEWCRYQMVKKFRRYVYLFWRDPRTWRTDRQTLHDSIDRACIASCGKNLQNATRDISCLCQNLKHHRGPIRTKSSTGITCSKKLTNSQLCLAHGMKTRSSAIAERPCDASCCSVFSLVAEGCSN